MSKKFFYKALICLVFVAAAVVWLLSEVMPEKFEGFETVWLLGIVPGVLGVLLIFQGIFEKNFGPLKKFKIFFGALLIIAFVLAFAGIWVDDNLVLPIIAIIITVAVLLSLIAVGGKKWDEGDNHLVGYKTYRERKAEEEKANRDNQE